MREAGTNFNHTPQKTKREGHVLVTSGVYAYLRHPSYCAFFWWAVGTQILVGNKASLLGFVFVLWNFFKRRIRGESGLCLDCFYSDIMLNITQVKRFFLWSSLAKTTWSTENVPLQEYHLFDRNSSYRDNSTHSYFNASNADK